MSPETDMGPKGPRGQADEAGGSLDGDQRAGLVDLLKRDGDIL